MEYIDNYYTLKCPVCGTEYYDKDKGFLLSCINNHQPALLRAQYNKKLEIRKELPGIFRYSNWLPVRRVLDRAEGPAVYRSNGLGTILGLKNLFVAFNGYWPEKNAYMDTCSFKELEAPGVLGRMSDNEMRTLVVSSAGNTGRAFLKACSENGINALIVVPESALPSLWVTEKQKDSYARGSVRIVALRGNVDYFDAIEVGDLISSMDGFFSEGGAKNVGRRDGMGIVILSAAEKIGFIPEHYFQAVGSGTGGIAAWEMSVRLLNDGNYGNSKMRLHLSQNEPFTPIKDAWERGFRELKLLDNVRGRINRIRAKVLSNRKPPYSITGGLYDALADSKGFMYGVSNAESIRAGRLFRETEGIDLDPAAEVAVASLLKAVKMNRVSEEDLILLNITGGGYKRLAMDEKIIYSKPDLILDYETIKGKNPEDKIKKIEAEIALMYEKAYI